MGDKSLL